MSIRPLARSAQACSLARPQIVSKNIRWISSTAARRAGHAGDEHHGDSSADTNESFFSPTMRNSLILTALLVVAYPYLPSPSKGAASPSLSPDAQSAAETPYITRMLAKYTPSAQTWTERNNKHLELTKQAAEDRLLVQEAERPRVWRMRYARVFEQASPHCIPVGSQMDLSDLNVKRD